MGKPEASFSTWMCLSLNIHMFYIRRLHRRRIVRREVDECVGYLLEIRKQNIIDHKKNNGKEGRLQSAHCGTNTTEEAPTAGTVVRWSVGLAKEGR